MPIQMFAMITETSDQSGEVSQFTGPIPTWPRAKFTTPESLFSIHDQVEAETISGKSQGTRNSARSTADSGKARAKNTARASPRTYWKNSETPVKTSVLVSAGTKVGSCRTVPKCLRPMNSAPPWTNERTV